MDIISAKPAELQPLFLIPLATSTGVLIYLPEPIARQAAGGTLDLGSLEIPATEPARPVSRYSEPRTLAQWALAFDVAPCTLSRWFRSGQVDARKAGKLWRVADRDMPRE